MKKLLSLGCIIFLFLSACSPSQGTVVPTQASPAPYSGFKYDVKIEDQQLVLWGNPYEIDTDNCGSSRDAGKKEERSQTYTTELNMEISNKVGIEFGGDVQVAKAVLSDEVGVALGIRVGSQAQASSSIEVVTPAGKKSNTKVQWQESWTKGTISIIRPDGTYIDVLPFTVLDSLSLIQLESNTLDCQTGQVESNVPTPQIAPQYDIARFAVSASIPKNRTGITVNEGDTVSIEYLDGQWTGENGKAPLTSGCGKGWHDSASEHVWVFPPDDTGDMLIGYINNQPFKIGCQPITFQASSSGELYLGMNDCSVCYWDNSGELYVKISVKQ